MKAEPVLMPAISTIEPSGSVIAMPSSLVISLA
jgi:hypothetical protein